MEKKKMKKKDMQIHKLWRHKKKHQREESYTTALDYGSDAKDNKEKHRHVSMFLTGRRKNKKMYICP